MLMDCLMGVPIGSLLLRSRPNGDAKVAEVKRQKGAEP